jgi:hypothetical protein
MAIDKIFKNSNVDDLADNVLNEVDDFMVSVDKMQQRKVAGNVQRVVQAFKQIETNITEKFDNVSNVLEKRVLTIKDGRDGATGINGRDGKDGRNGKDGINGKPGLQGPPGKDGIDGNDGVSVTNANIDFDGSLIINLSSGQQINAGEVVSPELEKKIIAVTRGGGSSGSVGDVTGPASTSDNRIARFDGTTGKLIQSSPVTLGDGGNMSNIGTIGATGLATLSGGAVIEGLTVGKGAGAVSGNTAVGLTALNVNTTGSQNTAVGELTLAGNLGGISNTAVGSTALTSNTSGNQNTAVGLLAAYSTTTGSDNVAIGSVALYSNTTFSGNIAIGSGALYSANGGSNSTVIGYSAGTLAYGGTNTFLGYGSGSSVTSGANNVIIGGYTGATAPISATGSNYIVLSDGAGTVRQTIDSSGNVGIGITAPTAKLQVAGNAIISTTDNTNAALRVTQLGTGDALLIEDITNPDASPFLINSGGVVVKGATVAYESSSGSTPVVQVHGATTNSFNVGYATSNWATNTGGGSFTFAKSRGGVIGTHAIASASDILGIVSFMGSDGTAFIPSAQITGTIDATPGTGDMPGRLTFSTTADGASSVTERMRIDSAGNVGIGATANASAILDAQSTTKGVRMPNMTTTQKNAIASPAAGLMVFDTTLAKLCVYSGSAWQTITSV